MRWHVQQVMPIRHIPHALVSWGHETTCCACRAAIAPIGVEVPEGSGEEASISLLTSAEIGIIPGGGFDSCHSRLRSLFGIFLNGAGDYVRGFGCMFTRLGFGCTFLFDI